MEGIRVVCVCTHNQTRSVIAAALVGHHLEQAGVEASVTSAGVRAGGAPPTDETVRLLAARGIDVSSHRSRPIDDATADAADLIVTAERDHVIHIAGRSPARFPKTFTLPELVTLGEAADPTTGQPLTGWLAELGRDRPAAFDYLDAPVDEIADPTGRSRREWIAAMALIDDLSSRLASLLARHVVRTGAES